MRWCVWSLGVVLLGSPALADRCPAPEGGSAALAQINAEERIEFLHRNLDEQARHGRSWRWWWFGIGSVILTTSVGITIGWAAASPSPVQNANFVDNLIAAGFAVAVPVTSALLTLRVESDAPAIDELLRVTGGGRAGACLVLARMEELAARDAADEALYTGWLAQLAGFVGVGAIAGIMAIEAATASDPSVRDVHWINAAVNAAAGIVLAEAHILSAPTGASRGYEGYLKGRLRPPSRPTISLALGTGLSLRVTW
ncbi:MAG TPA: hypothetical protein VLM85_15705 [Polyangiaceae bacterium]|nr:hypothetical protein [Polyangiaceae bacterium]